MHNYYRLPDEIITQKNAMLQVEATCYARQTGVLLSATNFSFVPLMITYATTCQLVIGCR